MAALEVLIEQKPRSRAAIEHIDRLIAHTKAVDLDEAEKRSLIGCLKPLKVQSVGQAGRALVKALGARTYDGQKPVAFFKRCYDVRSDLIHGNPPLPDREQLGILAANLEHFLGDLLSRELDSEPRS